MLGRRPTYVEIDLGALRHNLRQVRTKAAKAKVLAVVKADAYGHGAAKVAPALQDAGADLFGVAIVEEGIELRRAGILKPILVLGGIYPDQERDLFNHDLTPTLYSLETACRLDRYAREAGRTCPYHLKIDTGMGRLGFRPEELPGVLDALSGKKNLVLEGVISHLAVADDPHHSFTGEQTHLFREMLGKIREAGFDPGYVHISNSSALFSCDPLECNLVRPGIVLYGSLPSSWFAGKIDLKPVMSLRTSVVQIKKVPAGTGISYGHRFVTERPSVLAAIPVGYADGYSRHLTGCGEALVRGRRVPVAGTVCMDWTMLDITDVPDVQVGDEVTLLGRDNGQMISAEEWAEWIGTIPYEVFCQISKRVPRIYRDSDLEVQESA